MFDVRLSFLLLSTLLPACCPKPPPPKLVYFGPTDPMEIVTADINRNSEKIPTLWTQLDYTATFIDPEKHTPTTVAGDGVLMYARPRSLLLNGDKDVAGTVFQIGSNDREFWLKIRSSANSFNYWWGHYASLGKPGSHPIPIRPDLVIEVLGVGLYRNNFLVSPTPVMRFDNAADAYIFDLNEIHTDRWETREEIWYDRASKLPTRVLLYGPNGRIVLSADLSQHTTLDIPGTPPDQRPKVARHYDLTFPDTGSHITFDLLNDPKLYNQISHHPAVPNANSFTRPDPEDGDKEIQIDPAVN